jgi:hypothetical protein
MGLGTSGQSFEELNEYLDERADEARPEEKERPVDSDPESDVDMTWLNELRGKKTEKTIISPVKQQDTPKSTQAKRDNNAKLTVPTPPPGTVKDTHLHSIPTPSGSLSPRAQSGNKNGDALRIPREQARTAVSMTDAASQGASSPATMTGGGLQPSTGSPMELSAVIPSPAQVDSAERASVGSPNQNLNPAPPAHSPAPYTPVQQEDAAIFEQKYFALIAQRMEQDRERQRRKEDNAGFIAPAADPEDDDAKYAEMWDLLKNMDPEKGMKDMRNEISREHREVGEHSQYDMAMQKRMQRDTDRDAALKASKAQRR